LALIAVSAVGLVLSAGSASAATITTPTGNPFVVPGDALGNPVPFTVAASGYTQGQLVYVEECDGTAPTAPGWSPTANCDLGSSPAAVIVDMNGVATFNASDPNHGFHPFKGVSPQGLFNCLSPHGPSPNNGLTDFRNCKIRVSTNNAAITADQAFLNIQLPDAVAGTTTTTTTSTTTSSSSSTTTTSHGTSTTTTSPVTTSTTTTTTSASTTTTTTPLTKFPIGTIHCDVSLTDVVKPPLTNTASPKSLKIKGKGTLSNCNNAGVTGGKYPITSGAITLAAVLPAGKSCANVFDADWQKIKFGVKWLGVNPKNGKPATVASTKVASSKTAALTQTAFSTPSPGFDFVSPAQPAKKAFQGSTITIHLLSDQLQADLQTECDAPDKKLGTTWNFTGVHGGSLISVP
jgi:hypothetical protein